ncbi:MAG: YbfB/YjiJ family MFS transporter [Candidatus Thiodiazotropha sp. (ex Ctena orbiculata)]|uniref:YbfB/YjiJ family MFS transporter n=1 Tax=Candidatus Thiodiazotropha taylori TaxID=2792791 RepID=A0A944M7Q2_9GAMM|nr:YbfB/YjiJ family MFS transporter [Candidatus Thiodiazotropha taylori]PUB89199.1 MAG: MFS transporter [gamma proteobacterium symbiont of Ctena orbiculata]MBT2988327.1 YbfB/YjiJ family MFS transporter [Candidatus Thiodiazotropha taylori]MBT2998786.1 YbfB/YjiJ family MFS transporter [Candidatus Thiodiazotropha taylori]MBT2999552.1 YbfB/YjiJ family MFS transporter [Candidatus Thiodiazotropha taylori]
MPDQADRLKVLIGGVISLILMLGIARFAYTPLLPIMLQQAGLGLSEGGWLTAINYLGYLCGAITASLISNLVLKDRLYRIGLIVAVVSTLGMGLTENIWLWSFYRFIAGLSSAAGLLLGSGLILNWLIRHGHRSELGIHFSGVGLGIAFGAIAVELMSHHFDWRGQWLMLSLMGTLMLLPAWAWLPPPDNSKITSSGEVMVDKPPSRRFLLLFMAAYFCAGAGYVVSATFIVAIIDEMPGLQGLGAWSFFILGMAAAPACILWDLVARRSGDIDALLIAFCLQTLGILLPVIVPSPLMAIAGSLLFGGTFIGIVSLVLTMAGRYYPTRPAKMMGKMTIAYGIAQIVIPAITGILAERSGSYSDGLYLAAAIMAVGTLLLFSLRGLEANHTRAIS